MNTIGRARNARLNQAMKHLLELKANLENLQGVRSDRFIWAKDFWADGRNALEQLIQCFHEANAYNNSIKTAEPRGPTATTTRPPDR